MRGDVFVQREVGQSEDNGGVEGGREEDGGPTATAEEAITRPGEKPSGEDVYSDDGHLYGMREARQLSPRRDEASAEGGLTT